MLHTARTRPRIPRTPLLAAALVVLILLTPRPAIASAETFGEITRFGEPALEPGKSGNGRIEVEGNHLLGVDTADNSVFVLEEPQEPKEPKKGEVKRFFRVQKFSSTGKYEGQSEEFKVTTNTEPSEEDGAEVQGIAVDPGAGELYFLVNAEKKEGLKNAGTEAASYLYALSTSTLKPASGTKKGVLAGPEALGAESEEEGSEPKALLEPRGITIDPSTHEVVILAKINVSSESNEFHWGLQRITTAGNRGELYIDKTDFLKQTFASQPGEPSSPTVTSTGQVLVEAEGHYLYGIAKIPPHFAEATERSTPPMWLIEEAVPSKPPLRAAEILDQNTYGGGLSVSPEGALLQIAGIENVEASSEPNKRMREGVFLRSSTTGAVRGWTGGQAQGVHHSDECVLQAGALRQTLLGEPTPQVDTGKEGRFFVLAPEFLNPGPSEEEAITHDAVIEFGPGGNGCPTDAAEEIAATEAGTVVRTPRAGGAVVLSSQLKLADSLSATWVIEDLATKAREETTDSEGRYDEAVLEHKFVEAGEYKVSVKIQTDDLAGPQQLETSRVFSVELPHGPMITKQPTGVTVAPEGSAVFEAEASGVPKPTVAWRVKKTCATHFEADPTDAGASTDTLTVKATPEDNGNEYQAVFTNEVGEIDSAPVKLTVTSAEPTVETCAASEVGPAEATLNATVNPNGHEITTCEFEYGLLIKLATIAPCTKAPGSGTSPVPVSARVSGLLPGFPYHFRIVATSAGGSTEGLVQTFNTTAASVAVSSINPASGPTAGGTAVIIKGTGFEESGLSVTIGEKAASEVKVLSPEEISARTPAHAAGNGEVVVKDAKGTSGPGPSFDFIPPCAANPAIETEPSGQTVTAPAEASFTVKEGAIPANCSAASIQWEVSTDGGTTFAAVSGANFSGATSATLRIDPTGAGESGHEFRAVLTNDHGSTNSSAVALKVNPSTCSASPTIGTQPATRAVTAPAEASFTVKEGAIPANCSPASIQWEVSTDGGTTFAPVSGSNVSGATSATLKIAPTSTSESGHEFRAVLTNAHGSTDSSAAGLTVNESLRPASTPESKPQTSTETPKLEVQHEIFAKPVSPKATIAGASYTVSPAGVVTFKVSCPSGAVACEGTVVLRTLTAVSASAHEAKSKKAILTLGTASFSLAGGESRAVTLHLSAKARTLLARSQVLHARAAVSAHNAVGETATTVTVITLRPAKRKH